MTEREPLLVYAAAYETVDAALADLDAVELAHMGEMIGQYDAAVIDKQDGKPHVVKRMDRPHIRVIPEWFGGGTLPRKELHEAAEQLTASQAGLVAVGEPTIEKGLQEDYLLQNAAWQVADQLGWSDTFDAEYVALTQLEADALITLDRRLADAVKDLVTVAPIEALS